MRWRLESVLTFVINTLWMQNTVMDRNDCVCTNKDLCTPISSSPRERVEVVIFHFEQNDWAQYHWSKITTIVVTEAVEDEFYCIAHAYNIRLVLQADIDLASLTTKQMMNIWMKHTLTLLKTYKMDGININFGDKLNNGSQRFHALTKMVLTSAPYFRNNLPGCQISFNVPWSPNCMNERCFNFLAISHVLDFFVVESFNIQNDMREGCVATSSTAYQHVLTGLSNYIKLGIHSKKLVMGVPWYGYDYTCKRFHQDGTCELKNTSQKDLCSYPVARRIPYKEIVRRLLRSLTGRLWNDDQWVPYFVYMDGKNYHQVWYDDPESISMKSTSLKRLKLGGIGVMNVSDLDTSTTARAMLHAEEMWNALCPP